MNRKEVEFILDIVLMKNITKEFVELQATDISTLKNARALSSSKKFSNHKQNADGDFFFAECSGSGKNPYYVSADFLFEEKPVYRCNCPSRKLPCKHSIGLLQEMANGATFEVAEIPADILEKRAKQEKRKENAEKKAAEPPKPKKVNKDAAKKKIQQQLEGLEIAESFLKDTLSKGISSLQSNPRSFLMNLEKQFGNYYLTGIQDAIKELAIYVNRLSSKDADFDNVIRKLVEIHVLVKKSKEFLNSLLVNEDFEKQDNELYEALGGVWKLEELNLMGLKKENAELLELCFYSNLEVETSYMLDLETGQVNPRYNYRPLHSQKYIKEEDAIYSVVKPSMLTYYPGEVNQRIRYNDFTTRDVTKEDIAKVHKLATTIDDAVKVAKNYLKNPLSRDTLPGLISFKQIGYNYKGEYILIDNNNVQIRLKSKYDYLDCLPSKSLYTNQVVFGEIYYDNTINEICLIARSIISKEQIVRL